MTADPIQLARLRDRIWALERGGALSVPPLPLGALGAALPWGGLPGACLHEIVAEDEAATGFAALLLAALQRRHDKPVLWCGPGDDWYEPGLTAFGLDPAGLILARTRTSAETLAAMEDGLRCPALAGVAGEIAALERVAARRLQLAAENGGGTGLALVRPGSSGGAVTRWRIASAPAAPTPWGGLGTPRWRIALERCRGDRPRLWLAEWRDGALVPVDSGVDGQDRMAAGC